MNMIIHCSIQFQLEILEFLYPFCFGKAHHMYDKHSVTMHAGMCVERSLIKDCVALFVKDLRAVVT